MNTMILEISKSEKFVTEKFIKFLVRFLKRYVLSSIEYIDNEKITKALSSLGIQLRSEEIILQGVSCLTYTDFGDRYQIHINHNKKIRGTNYTIESLCKLINYGNSRIKPTRIFSDPMDAIRNNLKKYFDVYCFSPC